MEDFTRNGQVGIALVVAGLVAVNFVYLVDLLAGEMVIILGPLSAVGLIVTNLAVLAGVVVLARAGAAKPPAAGSDRPEGEAG